MFVPIEQAAWPAAGEVRDLRFSLNAPVLLGPGDGASPTRAALGWLPAGPGAAVRLWLRADGAPQAVRAFDLPECPLGPAARATALERAERFLAGLGFLFPEVAVPQRLGGNPRTSDPDPEAEPAACESAADHASAVRADVRLTKFRRRGPRADQAASGAPSPTGGIEK